NTYINNKNFFSVEDEKLIVDDMRKNLEESCVENSGSVFRKRIEMDSVELNPGRIADAFSQKLQREKATAPHLSGEIEELVKAKGEDVKQDGPVTDFIRSVVIHGIHSGSLKDPKSVGNKTNELCVKFAHLMN